MRRSGLCLAAIAMFLGVELYAQCGVERWSVKTGTDADVSSVNLSTYTSSTIYNMQQSTHPASLPANNRVAPRELTQYRLTATLTKYKRESDSDYHLVIQDASGRTMIVELPSSNCVGGGSRFGTGISHARSQFDARLTATSTMKTTSLSITVKGVGFWDFLHGQTGVAPNGIELHPVLDVIFNTAKTGEEDIYVPEAVLPKDMVEDDDGGRVHVYRGGDALANALFHGGSVIETPRLHVIFAGESWNDTSRQSAMKMVRSIGSDARFEELSRYGVRTPMSLDGERQIGARHTPSRMIDGSSQFAAAQREMNDLDVQRLLAGAVDEGKIQHRDENVIYIVLLGNDTSSVIGSSRDWMSYHSQFHPTELAMPYVVVRGGLNGEALRDAMFASVARALVNPSGNGWY